jgi:hypothetical protein
MDERQLWLAMERLAEGWTKDLTITTVDAQLIMREIHALQRIVREMGTGEALLVKNVYEHFPRLGRT